MGVLGLWNVIESVGHPIKVDGLEGKRLGVDANVWLYKFIRGFREKDNVANLDSHKLGLFNRISKLLYYKIKPVFVFDGPAPTLKRRTLEKRQTTRNKNLLKVQDAAMKVLAEQLKKQYPDAKLDDLRIQLPKFESNNLVAAEKLTDEDRDLFYLPPDVREYKADDGDDESDDRLFSSDSSDSDCVEVSPVKQEKKCRPDDPAAQYHHASAVNINSEDFEDLPAEIRYEILTSIKQSKKRILNAESLPEDANSFSNLQLQRLRARRNIQEKIEKCEKDICSTYTGEFSDGYSIQAFRVQSDAASTMILRNNKLPAAPTSAHPFATSTPTTSNSTIASTTKVPQIFASAKRKTVDDYEDHFRLPPNFNDVEFTSDVESDEQGEEDKADRKVNNTVEILSTSDSSDSDCVEVSNGVLAAKKKHESTINITSGDSEALNTSLSSSSSSLSLLTSPSLPVTSPRTSAFKGTTSSPKGTVEQSTPQAEREALETEAASELDKSSLSMVNERLPQKSQATPPKTTATPITESDVALGTRDEPTKVDTKSNSASQAELTTETTQEPASLDEPAISEKLLVFEEPAADFEKPAIAREPVEPKVTQKPATPEEPVPTSASQNTSQSTESAQASQKPTYTYNAHNKVTTRIVEEAKELLRLFGIPYIDATGEAEAQCALLEELKLTDGTITDDSDIWLFGAQNVYRYFFSDDKYVMQYKMTDIEYHVRLTRENLVCFAMLVGSDYTDGVMNVGPVKALDILADFPGPGMEPLVKFKQWHEGSKKRSHPTKAELKQLDPEERKRVKKYSRFQLADEFPSSLIFEGYMNPTADDSPEEFVWGTPELDELREYARRHFAWDPKKIDEKLLPVMKKLSERRTQKTIDSFFQVSRPQVNKQQPQQKRARR